MDTEITYIHNLALELTWKWTILEHGPERKTMFLQAGGAIPIFVTRQKNEGPRKTSAKSRLESTGVVYRNPTSSTLENGTWPEQTTATTGAHFLRYIPGLTLESESDPTVFRSAKATGFGLCTRCFRLHQVSVV